MFDLSNKRKHLAIWIGIGIAVVCLMMIIVMVRRDASHQNTSGETKEQTTMDNSSQFKYSYGVFLDVNPEDMSRMDDYYIIVIEGQDYNTQEIQKLHDKGHLVYSYLNIGSIETWRSYYSQFEPYQRKAYENWEDEYWMDVSATPWKNYLVNDVARNLKQKEIDGFFVDNCDVYDQYQDTATYDGLKTILTGFRQYKVPVIINGGDTFVTKLIQTGDIRSKAGYRDLHATYYSPFIITGVNQESVFSKIDDYKNGTFSTASDEDREYFQKYLQTVSDAGLDVYLLEYTKDSSLVKQIRKYCEQQGYKYYISETVNLD